MIYSQKTRVGTTTSELTLRCSRTVLIKDTLLFIQTLSPLPIGSKSPANSSTTSTGVGQIWKMRAIYHRFDGILTWKWVWSVLYWFGNEVAWAIDYRSTSFPGAAVQLIHTCQLSRIRQQSPGLPYGSPNLPDKIAFWAFLCFTLEFIPFSPKIRIGFDSKFGFWGILEGITSLTKIISPLHP